MSSAHLIVQVKICKILHLCIMKYKWSYLSSTTLCWSKCELRPIWLVLYKGSASIKGHSFFSPMCIFIWCVHVNKSTTEYKVFEFDVWAMLTDLPNSIHPDLVTAAYTCKQCVWLSYWWQKYPLKPLPHSAHMATLLFWGTLRCWITSLIMPGEGCFSDVKQFLTVLLFLTKRHNCTEDIV